jgi:uncharacterized protein YgbK (DUF1537 family)
VTQPDWPDVQRLLQSVPPQWAEPLLPEIQSRISADGRRLVFLDDDPTGGQTLHGLAVLARWDLDSLLLEAERSPAFFILTNSRALSEAEAVKVALEVGTNLREVERRTGRPVVAGYRGDSTLRGHFPAETDALWAGLTGDEVTRPRYILAPYFAEGGRFTIHDTQYVQQGARLVSAAETEFARDRRFPYMNSHLPSWVEERSAGRIRASDVIGISLDDIRAGGPNAVAARLRSVPDGGVALMNAACERDLEVFVAGLLEAEAAGSRFVYRTAASFVRVRAGIEPRPLLTAADLHTHRPGLIIVGSYTERTTSQLTPLLALDGVSGFELRADAPADDGAGEKRHAAAAVSQAIASGNEALLYTSRDYAALDGIGERIAAVICEIIQRLEARPGYVLVKGGSTAHAVATRGLGMQRGVVLGQLLPGVPVWRLGPESLLPDIPYVIFPGNVGGLEDLVGAVRVLRGEGDAGER